MKKLLTIFCLFLTSCSVSGVRHGANSVPSDWIYVNPKEALIDGGNSDIKFPLSPDFPSFDSEEGKRLWTWINQNQFSLAMQADKQYTIEDILKCKNGYANMKCPDRKVVYSINRNNIQIFKMVNNHPADFQKTPANMGYTDYGYDYFIQSPHNAYFIAPSVQSLAGLDDIEISIFNVELDPQDK